MYMRLSSVVLLLSLVGAGCGVITPSDFSLQVDTSTAAVQRGTSTDVLVRISRTGRQEPVQVTLRNLPSGASVEPVQIPVGQESATLHVRVTTQAVIGDHDVEVVATALSRTDTDSMRLQVTDIPASAPIVVASTPSPLVLEKGRTHDVTFVVDRSGGFSGGFRVTHWPGSAVGTWVSFEPILVPYDATQFTLTLTVDEHQPVGSTTLGLDLRSDSNSTFAILSLPVDITGPREAPPQLTALAPLDVALSALTHFTLTGTGLSSTTAVTVKNTANSAQSVPARLLSATSGEIQFELKLPSSWGKEPSLQLVMEVQTPTGTVTLPLALSPLYVEPLTGSDTAGRGTLSRPFATIQRAIDSCGTCPWGVGSSCSLCTITLAPGSHRAGSLSLNYGFVLEGSGDLYGGNPSVIEGTGEERFKLYGSKLRQVKVTGHKYGLEANGASLPGDFFVSPSIADVWLTGGDYGISKCAGLRVTTETAPVRISHNRIAGVSCEGLSIQGSATWPVEVTHNGDGSAEAGGVLASRHVSAQYLIASQNRGPGVKASSVTIRNSVFQQNEGPGVWIVYAGGEDLLYASVPNLGTVESPGGNTLQDNAINFRVDSHLEKPGSAVGNCWNPPEGEDYADASTDGTCGRILKPFSLGDVTYIDAQGLTQGTFTWSAPPRFNYYLDSRFSRTPSIQF